MFSSVTGNINNRTLNQEHDNILVVGLMSEKETRLVSGSRGQRPCTGSG
jgi:hypothetical protein